MILKINIMEKINEIKIPEGVDRIAVKQYDDKIVFEFIPKEPKFKKGDFVYEDGRIMIVKDYPDNYYAIIYPKLGMKPVYNGRYAPSMPLSSLSFRCATEDEEQLLIDAMEKDGKRWNAEKLIVEDMPQFKQGDILSSKHGILIFKGVDNSDCMEYYAFSGNSELYYDDKCMHDIEDFKIATEDEKQLLIETMEKDGKRWNAEAMEIEDILKKGDLAIFWDNDYRHLSIRLYDTKSRNRHFDNFGSPWDNAVKWDGTKEQFEKVLRGEID